MKMSEIIKKMEMVGGNGMPSSSGGKLPSDGKNSMRDATLAYERMCEGTKTRVTESSDVVDIKKLGALQAIKEMLNEGDVLDKKNADSTIKSIKTILSKI